MAYTKEQLDEIQQVQEQRSLTRKSAIQFCTRKWKAAQANTPAPAELKVTKGDAADLNRVFGKKTKAPRKAAKKAKAKASERLERNAKLTAKAVALYKQGDLTLTDLAAKVTGKTRGTGMNFTRSLLIAAGVWKKSK